MKRKWNVGTRGSSLALIQTRQVIQRLKERFPDDDFDLIIVKTTGDVRLDVSLSTLREESPFSKELDRMMLAHGIDLAVHSLKDLPSNLEPGIELAGVPGREDPRDAWLSSEFQEISQVPPGAVVLTGSLRRKAQLLHFRPDLSVQDLRGNVPTRMDKMRQPGIAGGVLALAAARRLGIEHELSQVLDADEFIPAASQGALGITCRKDDKAAIDLVKTLEDADARLEVEAERSFLRALQGGCRVPMGCYSSLRGGLMTTTAFVSSIDGTDFLRHDAGPESVDSAASAREVGTRCAQALLDQGADRILRELEELQ